jgi:hypothetical protein
MVICGVKRDEVVTCLKEITVTCTSMSPDSVTLFNSKPDDLDSTGYQVHIKAVLDNETKQRLQNIAEKHSLALREEKGNSLSISLKKPRKQLNMLS